MGKILFLVVLISLFALSVAPALALQTGLNYGTYTSLGTKDLREGVMSIVRVLFGFLAIIAIVGIIAGGVLIMTSGGDEQRNSTGKQAITAGVIGLVIIFSAYALAAFVINSLVSATGAN